MGEVAEGSKDSKSANKGEHSVRKTDDTGIDDGWLSSWAVGSVGCHGPEPLERDMKGKVGNQS